MKFGKFYYVQKNRTANSAHLDHFTVNWLNWQCCLAGSFKTSPKFLIFFQLPWMPIIHLSLFPLSIECPNLLGIMKFSQAVCILDPMQELTLFLSSPLDWARRPFALPGVLSWAPGCRTAVLEKYIIAQLGIFFKAFKWYVKK